MHLAIGLLAQPLYFWKPALDNLILSPRHQLSGTLFSPQSKSSSSSCPSPPAGITVPAIKITLSELHGQSHFTLGLPDQPTGQTRASENTMGTLSPYRSPALPGRERHLPHKLAHVDIPHGHTPARPPQALLQHPLEPTSPWPAPLYLLPLKPSNSLKELSTHALCTSSPSACSLTYSRLKFHSHQFIHSFIQQHTQHHIRWVSRGKFLWSRSPAHSQSLNPMDTHFKIMHSFSSIHELLRMYLNSPWQNQETPGTCALRAFCDTSHCWLSSHLSDCSIPASSADFSSLNCCSVSGLSGLNSFLPPSSPH